MKFTAATASDALFVRSYDARGLATREGRFTSSTVLTASRCVADWPPRSAAEVTLGHLATVLDLGPEVVLLGTGERQVFPDMRLYAHLASRGVGLEVMDTGAACRTYNVLLHEGRRVALAVLIPGG